MAPKKSESSYELPKEVIDEDKRLDALFVRSSKAVQKASIERDRLRYEHTDCPNGPGLSYTEYGRQVGRMDSVIGKSARVYAATFSGVPECFYGSDHKTVEVEAPEDAEEPTDEELVAHEEASRKVGVSDIVAAIIAAISNEYEVTATTVKTKGLYGPIKAAARIRVADEVDLNAADAEVKVAEIVRELRVAADLEVKRAEVVRKWMADNRACGVNDVPKADAESKLALVHHTAKTQDIPYAAAEKKVRELDHKMVEAERNQNERDRQHREAVVVMEYAMSDLVVATGRVVKASAGVASEGIEMTEDERASFGDKVKNARAALDMADAAINGVADVDWDAALAGLVADGGAL